MQALNARVLNRAALNSGREVIAQGSGQLVSFSQEVTVHYTGSGQLIYFSQNVQAVGSGALVTFSQMVRNASDTTTFLSRNGWYPILVIDGRVIPDNQIHGVIEINRVENDAALMSFTLIPSTGALDISQYESKSVTLDIAQTTGTTSRRVYTGIVNLPSIDLINGKLNFTCTDNRRERINSELGSLVPYIGLYNTDVFGVATDLASELDKRLLTVPVTVDFNVTGMPFVTPLLALADPDFTLDNDDVYREDGRDPEVKITPRNRIVNTVNVKADYQFQRLYHRQINFSWEAPYNGNACDFLSGGYSVASREMVKSAADAAGWPIRGDISYTPILAAGFYNCNGGTRGWSTSKIVGQSVAATKVVNGSTVPVLDSSGNPVYNFVPTGSFDTGATLCFGASWQATKRWVQNITESYTISVAASQSVNQYGTIAQDDSVGITSEFDSSQWENYPQYRSAPTGYSTTPAQPASNYYFNMDTNLSGWYTTVGIMLNKAKTTLIKSHRDNRVIFNRRLWPEIDLYHTVYLDCTRLQAQGKVYSITHKMDVTTGEATTKVELCLSRAQGSASTDSFHVPTRPTYAPSMAVLPVVLDSHFGLTPQSVWTGYIGNKYLTTQAGNTTDTRKTTFTEQFIVETPAIEDAVRANKVLPGLGSFNIEIQNDLLEVVIV